MRCRKIEFLKLLRVIDIFLVTNCKTRGMKKFSILTKLNPFLRIVK